MNKIVDAEQKAAGIRGAAASDAKASQADAARQGKEMVDKARKAAEEKARAVVARARADAREIHAAAGIEAEKKALRLKAVSEEKMRAAARFITERIVDSV